MLGNGDELHDLCDGWIIGWWVVSALFISNLVQRDTRVWLGHERVECRYPLEYMGNGVFHNFPGNMAILLLHVIC